MTLTKSIAAVAAAWSRSDGQPLLYVDRAYHTLGEVLPWIHPEERDSAALS